MNAGQVIGDNFWLWRADHSIGGASVTGGFYPCLHGLVVNGDSVAMYGLAAEHTLEDLTVWRGDKGATYFYQSELPYDVSEEAFGEAGYVGYRVDDAVTEHSVSPLICVFYFNWLLQSSSNGRSSDSYFACSFCGC